MIRLFQEKHQKNKKQQKHFDKISVHEALLYLGIYWNYPENTKNRGAIFFFTLLLK